MTKAKRQFIIRDPKAWAERQHKASAAAAAARRLNAIPVEVRFWRLVSKTDGCWEWRGYVQKGRGYGLFSPKRGERWPAHRYAWKITNGDIPSGLFVCHSCDNRKCVRIDHLFLGTNADNMRDAGSKNRLHAQSPQVMRSGDGRFKKKSGA